MLECVTLAQVVKLMVEVLVNLPGGPVFYQEAAKNAETTHPHDLAVKRTLGQLLSSCPVSKSAITPPCATEGSNTIEKRHTWAS